MDRTNCPRELERPLFWRRFSRARFLRLVGAGAGIPFIPTSLVALGGRASGAQTTGTPAILTGEEYPIGLWWPPPPEETTVERYKQIADAGFNFVIGGNGVTTDDYHAQALTGAAANDLRFVLTDSILQNTIRDSTTSASASTQEDTTPSLMQQLLEEEEGSQPSSQKVSGAATSNPREAVRTRIQRLLQRYGPSPALAGLNLFDEPHRSLFGILGFAKSEVLQQFAGEELPYVNIWPSHASSSALGTRTYERYLELYFEKANPPLLCFDHYPLLRRNKITSDYFYNWAVIRRFSLRFGVPSWIFIQSVGFDGSRIGLAKRRRPDEHEIFWQINVSLAYGAKGIQYFTYWTPSDPRVRFGDALVTRVGQLTSLYQYATNANNYLRVVGKVLLPLTSEFVVHARERRLPRGARAFRADGYVRAVSGSPVILSRFKDPDGGTERYLLVANRSFLRAAETRLTLSDSVSEVFRLDTETGAFVPVTLQGTPPRNLPLKIPRGRAQLYLLRTS